MAFGLLIGSFPKVPSITKGGRCSRSRSSAKNYDDADSMLTTSIWNKTNNIQNECGIVTNQRHNLKYQYKGIKSGSLYMEFQKKYFMNATSAQSNEFEPQIHVQNGISDSLKHWVHIFYKFSRLPALISMIVSIICGSLLTVDNFSDLSPTFFLGLFQYITAVFCMQVYNIGVNQIADLESDKINKPDLPLASGEFPVKAAVITVALCVIMSFGIGMIVGSRPLLGTLLSFFVLASAYSINLPLLRWKGSTILSIVYNVGSVTIVSYLGPFLHMQTHVLKRRMIFPKSLIFSILMTCLIWAPMTILKDLPDIEGDKAQGIKTLAVQLGPKPVFWISVLLIEMAYGVAILVGATSSLFWSKIVTVLAHAILAISFGYRAKFVDLESKADVSSFYKSCFTLVLLENFLIPFVR